MNNLTIINFESEIYQFFIFVTLAVVLLVATHASIDLVVNVRKIILNRRRVYVRVEDYVNPFEDRIYSKCCWKKEGF